MFSPMLQLHFAHITATDVGFGIGLFVLGVLCGALLVTRMRGAAR